MQSLQLTRPQTRTARLPTSAQPALPSLPTVELFDLPVASVSKTKALDWLCDRLMNGQRANVAFLNAHCVNQAAIDPTYQRALKNADVVLPDGSGIALAAKLQRTRIQENLNGTDLIPELGTRLAELGYSVFLLGGRPGVAAQAAASLAKGCPGLRIAGVHHGYFGVEEEDDVVAAINASGADVLLVAMGVPMQELWIDRVSSRLTTTLNFGVGGLFDFLSGRIPRAPKLLRRTGMEWTYRLYQEPARMWRRYVIGNPMFIARAIKEAAPARQRVAAACDAAAVRGIDVIGAAAGLATLMPVLALVSIAIRATSVGPALFRQTRIGKDGEPFTVFKFRSMHVTAEKTRAALEANNHHGTGAVTFKLKRDPRITSIGRFIRKSSIDELPQLWNVLRGDMSLVGPRPPLPSEVARYTTYERTRLAVKPGITCLWQISGRADIPFERQVDMDREYIRRRSALTNLGILARTVPAVLLARGAY